MNSLEKLRAVLETVERLGSESDRKLASAIALIGEVRNLTQSTIRDLERRKGVERRQTVQDWNGYDRRTGKDRRCA